MTAKPYELRADAGIAARVAAFPVSAAQRLLAAEDPIEATRDFFAGHERARTALAIASPSLAAEIETWIASGALHDRNVALKALSYALRMTARCTPFGLFAGVGIAPAGAFATLALESGPAAFSSATRPDMELFGLVADDAEADELLRERLRYFTNECVTIRGDRLHVTNVRLTNVADGDEEFLEQRGVTLRNTKAVAFVRDCARNGIDFAGLAARLSAEFAAPAADSRALLHSLVGAGVLVPETRLSPLGDGLRPLIDRLAGIGSAPAARLRDAAALAEAFDRDPSAQTPRAYAQVHAAAEGLAANAPQNALQVDLRAALRGTFPACVLADAEKLVELATRSGRVIRLDRFRRRFLDAYEGGGLVPLLELVDGDLGLGAPEAPSLDDPHGHERQAEIQHVLAQAIRENRPEVVLDDGLLERFFPSHGKGRTPTGMEALFSVAAAGAGAIECGEYRVVARSFFDRPFCSLGRFAAMFGDEFVERARRETALCERDDELPVEFAYVPAQARNYNLFTRPLLYRYRLLAGIGEPPDEHTLAPADLWVGHDGERFFLWSATLGRRIDARETHAFVTMRLAPNLCRFLAFLYRDGMRLPEFHLGDAEGHAYLPRLAHGRLVLRPRSWRVPTSALGGTERETAAVLREMRSRWDMPHYLYLRDGDNRLLLDLDSKLLGPLVRSQLRDKGITLFEEALPSPLETWLPGDTGAHAAEFVVQAAATSTSRAASTGAPARPVLERRRHGPGSRWTDLKFSIGRQAADAFVARTLLAPIAQLEEAGNVDRWFFVRGAEPRAHVRVRVRAAADGLAPHVRERLLAGAEGWLQNDAIVRYTLETYEPEYERYGGAEAHEAAEAFFHEDSLSCARLLAVWPPNVDERVEAAASDLFALVRQSDALAALAIGGLAKRGSRKLEGYDRQALRRIRETASGRDPALLLRALDVPHAEANLTALVNAHCNRLGLEGKLVDRVELLLRSLALGLESAKSAAR